MSTATSANVPAVIKNAGGALERVIRNVQLYTDQRAPLERSGMILLGLWVKEDPSLNNEKEVDRLVNLLSWHGLQDADSEVVEQMVDQYGSEKLHLAAEYLYEVGERGHSFEEGGGEKNVPSDFAKLEGVMDTLENLEENAIACDSVEVLERLINYAKGYGKLAAMGPEELQDLLHEMEGAL